MPSFIHVLMTVLPALLRRSGLAMLVLLPCVHAAERWQLVVLPDVHYQDASHTRDIHNAVNRQFVDSLTSADFDVLSPQFLGLSDCVETACETLTDQDIRARALASQREVNLALFYTLDISMARAVAVPTWRYELSARVLDLETGVQVEAFSTVRLFNDKPAVCSDACLNTWLVEKAGQMTQDVAAAMTEKLAAFPRRYRHQLLLRDFTPTELNRLYQYLTKMQGYVGDRLVKDFNNREEWLHQRASREYQYISELSGAQLRAQLEQFADTAWIPTKVEYQVKQRQFTLTRLGFPHLFRYLGTMLALLMLSYLLLVWTGRRRVQRELDRLAHGKHAQQWQQTYQSEKRWWLPYKAQWHQQQREWYRVQQQGVVLVDKAKQLAEQHDYTQALSVVEEAIALNQDDREAIQLRQRLLDYRRGFDRLRLASSEMEVNPAAALPLLEEAKVLNPSLSEQIAPLYEQALANMHQALGETSLNDATRLIEQQHYFAAYSIIDKALHLMGGFVQFKQESTDLLQLRAQLAQHCPAVQGNVQGQGNLKGSYFFPANMLEISRSTDAPMPHIAIGYRRISRAGKQTRLQRRDGAWFAEDLGSANGTLINKQPVMAGSRVKIEDGAYLAVGAGQSSMGGACQLTAALPAHTSATMILRLAHGPLTLMDDSQLFPLWPSLDEDKHKTWVLLDQRVGLWCDDEQQLGICERTTETPVAWLLYQHGYYIEPAQVRVEQPSVFINDAPVFGRVPVSEGALLRIGDATLTLERIEK